jgi:hypothetical protein
LGVDEVRLHATGDARYLRVEVFVHVGMVLHAGKKGNKVAVVGLSTAVDDAREPRRCSLSAPGMQGCPMRSGNVAPCLGPIHSVIEGGGCPSEGNVFI